MEDERYATVLVAVLREPRDLCLAREEGWYRIPVPRLPPRASTARYIAFYQPGSFGAAGGVVRYVAQVRGWELARRRDLLPGEPAHARADELYYCLRLGPLQELPRPVRSGRWKRVAFIVTHWERLQQAVELRDLLHGSRWDECLWRALRRAQVLA